MAQSVEIDFEVLDSNITKLKNLKKKLKKPEISFKYDMITSSNEGKGSALDAIFDTTLHTKEYYDVAMALIENTITYLNSIKEVQNKDVEIAKKIEED